MNRRLKNILAAAIFCSATVASFAQTATPIYFIENNPIRHELNPAFATEQGYFSIPLLGNLSINTKSNISLSSFIYPNGETLKTFLDSSIPAAEAMSCFDKNNNINANFEMPIISFGFNAWGGFNTFGINTKVQSFANIPNDLFAFPKIGMSNPSNSNYSLAGTSMSAYAFAEVAFGHSREIIENLRVGAKVKVLLGVMNMSAQVDKYDISLSKDLWSIAGDASIQSTGLPFTYDTDDKLDGIDDPQVGINGTGIAIDLGGSYQIGDNITVSASITDLGFISWKDTNTCYAKTNSNPFMFDGFDEISFDSDNENNSIDTQLDNMVDDLESMMSFYEVKSGLKKNTNLPTLLTFGGEYGILNNKISFGLLSTTSLKENHTWTDAMISANLSPAKWFTFGLNYSFSNLGTGYGALINITGAHQNFFVGVNSMSYKFAPQGLPIGNASLGFNLGWNVMLGKAK